MKIHNKNNSNMGGLGGLKSWMLIGRSDSDDGNISMQYSEVDPGHEQPLHEHAPEQ